MSSQRRQGGKSAFKSLQSSKLKLIKETKNNAIKVQHFSVWLDQVVKLIQTTINTKSAQLFLAGNFAAIVEHNTKIVEVRLQQTDVYDGRRRSSMPQDNNAKTPSNFTRSSLGVDTPGSSVSAIPHQSGTFSLLRDLQTLGDRDDEEAEAEKHKSPTPIAITLDNVHDQGLQALQAYCNKHKIDYEKGTSKQILMVQVTIHLAKQIRSPEPTVPTDLDDETPEDADHRKHAYRTRHQESEKVLLAERIKRHNTFLDNLAKIIGQIEASLWTEFQEKLKMSEDYQAALDNNNIVETTTIIAQFYLFGLASRRHQEDPEVKNMQEFCRAKLVSCTHQSSQDFDKYRMMYWRYVRMSQFVHTPISEPDIIFHFVNNLDANVFGTEKTRMLQRTSSIRTKTSLTEAMDAIQEWWDSQVMSNIIIMDPTTHQWMIADSRLQQLYKQVGLRQDTSSSTPKSPDSRSKRATAEACKAYKKGSCKWGDKCKYSHSKAADHDTVNAVATHSVPQSTKGPMVACHMCKRNHSQSEICREMRAAVQQAKQSSERGSSTKHDKDSRRKQINVIEEFYRYADANDADTMNQYYFNSEDDSEGSMGCILIDESDNPKPNQVAVNNTTQTANSGTIMEDSGACTHVAGEYIEQLAMTDVRNLDRAKKMQHFAGGVVEATKDGHMHIARFLVVQGVKGAILASGKICNEPYKWYVDPKGRYKILIDERLEKVVMYFFKTDSNQYIGQIDWLNQHLTKSSFLRHFKAIYGDATADNELFKIDKVFENNTTTQSVNLMQLRSKTPPLALQVEHVSSKGKHTKKKPVLVHPIEEVVTTQPEQVEETQKVPIADTKRQSKKQTKLHHTAQHNKVIPEATLTKDYPVDSQSNDTASDEIPPIEQPVNNDVEDDDVLQRQPMDPINQQLRPLTKTEKMRLSALHRLWKNMGNSSPDIFKKQLQTLRDNTFHSSDVDLYIQHLGPNPAAIQGNMIALQKQHAEHSRSYKPGEVLDCDLVEHNGDWVMQVVDRGTLYTWNIELEGINAEQVFNGFKHLKADLLKYGHGNQRHIIKTDNASTFSTKKDELMLELNMEIDPTASGHHAQQSEGRTAVVRRAIASVKAGSSFATLPAMQKYLRAQATDLLNIRPTKRTGITTTPWILLKSKSVSVKDVKTAYGALVIFYDSKQRKNQNTKTTLDPTSEVQEVLPVFDEGNNGIAGKYGIVVRQPLDKKNKYYVYDIHKETIVTVDRVVEIPPQHRFIKLMNLRLIKALTKKKSAKEIKAEVTKSTTPTPIATEICLYLYLNQNNPHYLHVSYFLPDSQEDTDPAPRYYFGDYEIDMTIKAISPKDARAKFGEETLHAKKIKEFRNIIDRNVIRAPCEGDPKYTSVLRVNGHYEEKPDPTKDLADTLKFRACCNGKPTKVTKQDSASPTVQSEHINATINAALFNGYTMNVGDVDAAFLQVDTNFKHGEHYGVIFSKDYTAIILEIKPEWQEYVDKRGQLLLTLEKAWYGTKEAALWFFLDISEYLINTMGYLQMKGDPCIFTKRSGQLHSILVLHVDDVLFCGSSKEINEAARKMLEQRYGPLKWQDGDTIKYLGQRIVFDYQKKEMRIDQQQYIEKLAAKYPPTAIAKTPSSKDFFHLSLDAHAQTLPPTKFRSMVMSVSYVAQRTIPEILKEVGFLATRQQQPTIADYDKAQQVINYVHYRKDRPLILRPKSMKLTAYADAAYAIHVPDLKSHGGTVIMLGGAPVLNKSKKIQQRCTSSCHAETVQLFLAKQITLSLHSLLKEMDFIIPVEDTPVIFQDNQSTIRLTEPGYHHPSSRSKNFAVQYLDIREAVERKEINIVYLPTIDMIADLHTKPLQGRLFKKFRDILIGTS